MPEDKAVESDVHASLTTLHIFFDAYHLPDALQYVHSSVLAALSTEIWNKHQPADLLHFIDKMQSLREAAHELCEEPAQPSAIIIEATKNVKPDVTVINHYTPAYSRCDAWGSFPRHLTARQYHNPYKAIQKFCKYRSFEEWNHFLQELLYYALSTDEITVAFDIPDVLKMQKRLLQLIEACHLIEVRVTVML